MYTQRDTTRALAIAQTTGVPALADWIYWFAATYDLNRTLTMLKDLEGEKLHRRLAGLWLAMEPRANVPWTSRVETARAAALQFQATGGATSGGAARGGFR